MKLPIGSMNSAVTIAFNVYINGINRTGTIVSSRTTTGAGLSIFQLSDNHWRFDNMNNTNTASN
jgi:hypothetical protein